MASVRASLYFCPSYLSYVLIISNVSGTLSSNLPNDSVGSFEKVPLDNIPGMVGQGGGVMFDQIVSSGGCNATSTAGDSSACAVQNTYVINAGGGQSATAVPALNCPAPRLDPTVIPNGNKFSNSFTSQMLLLFGTFNTSLWDDGGGLKDGEVVRLHPVVNSMY
jgi:hypothetical protein